MREATTNPRLLRATLLASVTLVVLTLARGCGWNPAAALSALGARVERHLLAYGAHR
jgi:hypothetical protein